MDNRLRSEGLGKDNRFAIVIRASKSIDYERNGNEIYAYIKYTQDISYRYI